MDPEFAARRFRELTEAYEVLTGRRTSSQAPPSSSRQPWPPQAQQRSAAPPPREVFIEIADSWPPGSQQVVYAHGQMLRFIVPTGVQPGDKIRLEVQSPGRQSPPAPPSPPRNSPYRRTSEGGSGANKNGRSGRWDAGSFWAGLSQPAQPPLKPLWSFGDKDGALRLVIRLPEDCNRNAWLRVAVPDGRVWRFRARPRGPGSRLDCAGACPKQGRTAASPP